MAKTVDDEVPEQWPPQVEPNSMRTTKARQVAVGQGRQRVPIVIYRPSDRKDKSPDSKDSQGSDD